MKETHFLWKCLVFFVGSYLFKTIKNTLCEVKNNTNLPPKKLIKRALFEAKVEEEEKNVPKCLQGEPK